MTVAVLLQHRPLTAEVSRTPVAVDESEIPFPTKGEHRDGWVMLIRIHVSCEYWRTTAVPSLEVPATKPVVGPKKSRSEYRSPTKKCASTTPPSATTLISAVPSAPLIPPAEYAVTTCRPLVRNDIETIRTPSSAFVNAVWSGRMAAASVEVNSIVPL